LLSGSANGICDESFPDVFHARADLLNDEEWAQISRESHRVADAISSASKKLPQRPNNVTLGRGGMIHGPTQPAQVGVARARSISQDKGGQSTSDRVQAGQVTPKREESTPSRNQPSLLTRRSVAFILVS